MVDYKHRHEYKDTGKTLRFHATKGCVICSRQHNRENAHKFQSAYVKHDRGEASLHCAKYQDCLDRDLYEPGFKMNCPCDKFEFVENNYLKELELMPCNADFNEITECGNSVRNSKSGAL